jgi:UPF0755 protein
MEAQRRPLAGASFGAGAPRRLRRFGGAVVLFLTIGMVSACARDTTEARVMIPAGATMRQAADSLAAAKVIRFPAVFAAYSAIRSRDRTIKAGTYLLSRASGWNETIAALHQGKGLMTIVVVPEGFALSRIVPLLAMRLKLPPESLEAAARDTALLHALDVPTPTLEGYLFPDTYSFPEGTTAAIAIRTMVRRFQRVWRPEWTARLDSIPMSRHDVLTLASIVETEARLGPERPVIAAVYMNRLRKGMLLQADPTVQYALPQRQARLLYKHLEIQSPYNTYRRKGLPPGPIGSPGRASIEAALYPSTVPYLYVVAFPDGHHEFRTTLAAHDKAKREARRAWDSTNAARARSAVGASRERP